MKKSFIIIVFILLFSFAGLAQNLTTLDDKYGFRDYKFETNVSQFENLKLVEEVGFKVYTKQMKN